MSVKKIVFPLIGQPKDRQRKTKYGHICFWAKNGKMGFVRFDKSGEHDQNHRIVTGKQIGRAHV